MLAENIEKARHLVKQMDERLEKNIRPLIRVVALSRDNSDRNMISALCEVVIIILFFLSHLFTLMKCPNVENLRRR